MQYKILIGIFAILFVVFYLNGGLRERMGTDFWHYGKLTDRRQHIDKEIALAKKLNAEMDAKRKEGFRARLEELPKDYVPDLKKDMKEEPIQQFDPDEYVISKYSFKAFDEPVTLEPVVGPQTDQLATASYAAPFEYNGKALADYLEVDGYNTGSGNMTAMKDAYKKIDRKDFLQTERAIMARGGNVYAFPQQECNADDLSKNKINPFPTTFRYNSI